MDIKNFKLNYAILTFLIVIVITLFRFLYITILPLSADEAYLWVCSRHPALSFYDTPPMAPYMILISTRLFGNTEFAVRVFVSVFMAATCYVIYLFSREVSGRNEKSAFFSTFMILTIPGFALAGLLSGVEAPLLFFYLLSAYFLYRAIIKEQPSYWYVAGLTTGLGFLSKYLILFLPMCLLLYLVFTDKKRYLKTSYPYLFLLIFFLISCPVVIWNAQNNWASFLLNFFSRRRSSTALSINFGNLLKHIGAQAGIISPFMLIMMVYGFFRMFFEGTIGKNKHMLFLSFFSGPILIFFILYALFIEPPAPHWAGIGYLCIIVALPYFILNNNCSIAIRRFFIISLVTAVGMTSIIHSIPFTKDFFLRLPINENTKKNFESFLCNFPSKVGKKLSEIKNIMKDKDNYFLIGRGFALASYLEFYNKGQETVYMICQRTKVGHGYYFWQDINENIGKNAIFVDEDSRCEDTIKSLFAKVERLPDFEIYNEKGELLMTFVFYNCINFKGMEKEKPPVLKR